jgi:hypothetical protein
LAVVVGQRLLTPLQQHLLLVVLVVLVFLLEVLP